MKANKLFMSSMIATVIVIGVAIIAAPGNALMSDYWMRPIMDIQGDTIEAGSPYSFSCQRSSSDDYYKVLMFLEDEDGTGVYKKVSIGGYYWLEPTGECVVYAIWIPYDTPTGKYTLRVSLQGHTWIYDSQAEDYKPWGPWTECASYAYEIYVYGHEGDITFGSVASESMMLTSTSSNIENMAEKADMSLNIQNVEGIDRLNAGQRAVLLQTLREELKQRGEI